MSRYATHYNLRRTPQSEPIPGSDQVKNSAGGYAWQIPDEKRLDRFLIIGTEGGTYYARERPLTIANAEVVHKLIRSRPKETLSRIVEISTSRRAPKNDPALFALAMFFKFGEGLWPPTAFSVRSALGEVARTGTHLFTFLEASKNMRGWGRRMRTAVAEWYTAKDPDALGYQVVKYRQRGGWTHRDAMRLSHPQFSDTAANAVAAWVTKGTVSDSLPAVVHGYLKMAGATTADEAVATLREHPMLPWETVPTTLLNEPRVWAELLPNMPTTALVRNLAKMTSIGLIAPYSDASYVAAKKLANVEAIRKSGIHPISVLIAMLTYQSGKGLRGKLSWTPTPCIVEALHDAFYTAFGNVEPIGQRIMIALDVSSSMGWPNLMGVPELTPCMVTTAMSMSLIRAEQTPPVTVAFQTNLANMNITKSERLDQVVQRVQRMNFGGTDCSLPMRYAAERKIPIDLFVIFTDSETWAGRSMHPAQALWHYRKVMGINAKLAVCAVTSTGFSIADPRDGGMMDLVGFDANMPQIVREFALI